MSKMSHRGWGVRWEWLELDLWLLMLLLLMMIAVVAFVVVVSDEQFHNQDQHHYDCHCYWRGLLVGLVLVDPSLLNTSLSLSQMEYLW